MDAANPESCPQCVGDKIADYINLKLAWLGCPTAERGEGAVHDLTAGLLAQHREAARLLADYLCPVDQRIQDFLEAYLQDVGFSSRLPGQSFVLDRVGLSRALSLPADGDEFHNEVVDSYRVQQGVLHNPKNDRRTTAGSFHLAEGGLPIPADKKAVPKQAFARMLAVALAPPRELMRLPFTSTQPQPAETWISLLIRPVVCPEVPGFTPEKSMELRFFAPGGLVSNLDFVETIFGNAGDPMLPENDAALDVDHWSGHTGCVILAPQLSRLTKKELGLPRWEEATERQRRDGMCWKAEGELYNDGSSFKVTCRDERGVIVTLISDNYFGYCKKEVKTQLSYAANLSGLAEEEHAGGALVFPSYDLGEVFSGYIHAPRSDHNFAEAVALLGEAVEVHSDGYAIDRRFPDICYVPEDARFDLPRQSVTWSHPLGERRIKLLYGRTYVRPNGYRVELQKPPGRRTWRLTGTVAQCVLCHKPSTVSGGGKSEISKPITDAILYGPVFVADFKRDFDRVAELLERDYGDRFREPPATPDRRTILSAQRSLGSVIKLLTPSIRDFTPEYNAWLESIPQHIKELVFVVKRFCRPEWGDRWREHFSVDVINGVPGNELKLHDRKLSTHYLRVGYDADGHWRTFGLRKDFQPAEKLSREDDITTSVVVPRQRLPARFATAKGRALKFVHNCELRLFQRPDEAIHRGQDVQTEADFAEPGNFFSNYEPLDKARAQELFDDSVGFAEFTEPMQQVIRKVLASPGPVWFVSSAHPRIVDGKPTKNPRYLQRRADHVNPRETYLTEVAMRLDRRITMTRPLFTPVDAVLPGRRNNPPEPAARIRPLAVFNPIHYLELPEAFMEFISSMTGKSPSTTGAGSEGALTKGAFNALLPIIDLNNALVSYLLTGDAVFVTSAGYIGPNVRVDHDISLLVPEIWGRMTPQERDPRFLIAEGYLERCEDFEHDGAKVLASRLGYRMTRRFVRAFFGRIFNHPNAVITDEMLRPETQDLAVFADGVDNIIGTHQRVAQHYFEDGSIELACPPLRALLHLMRDGHYEGQGLDSPEIRAMFTPEALAGSEWYRARLVERQALDVRLWRRHVSSLETFLRRTSHAREALRLDVAGRLERARRMLALVENPGWQGQLDATLGAGAIASESEAAVRMAR